MSIKNLEDFLIDNVKKAGEIALEGYKYSFNAKLKKGLDIVTDYDLKVQKYLIEMLNKYFPEDLIMSEEDLQNKVITPNNRYWIIDPIDGTINYASGLPFWSISLALIEEGVQKAGIVYAPILNEMYLAIDEKVSFIGENKKITQSQKSLSDSLISLVLTSHYNEEKKYEILNLINKLHDKVRGIRIIVSASLEICYVSEGILDLFYCPTGAFFSGAAATLIAKRNSCKLTDKFGNEYKLGISKSLVVSKNENIHNSFLEIFNNSYD